MTKHELTEASKALQSFLKLFKQVELVLEFLKQTDGLFDEASNTQVQLESLRAELNRAGAAVEDARAQAASVIEQCEQGKSEAREKFTELLDSLNASLKEKKAAHDEAIAALGKDYDEHKLSCDAKKALLDEEIEDATKRLEEINQLIDKLKHA